MALLCIKICNLLHTKNSLKYFIRYILPALNSLLSVSIDLGLGMVLGDCLEYIVNGDVLIEI